MTVTMTTAWVFLMSSHTGNHPEEATAADDPWLHHSRLQGGPDGPHEHRLPSDGVHLQSAGTVPHKGARAAWRRQRQGEGQADRPQAHHKGRYSSGLL